MKQFYSGISSFEIIFKRFDETIGGTGLCSLAYPLVYKNYPQCQWQYYGVTLRADLISS